MKLSLMYEEDEVEDTPRGCRRGGGGSVAFVSPPREGEEPWCSGGGLGLTFLLVSNILRDVDAAAATGIGERKEKESIRSFLWWSEKAPSIDIASSVLLLHAML